LSSAILPAWSLSRSVSKIYWSGSIKADMMDWNCRYKATAPAVSAPVTNTRNAIAEAEHDLQRRRWWDRRRARSPLAIALLSRSLSLSLSRFCAPKANGASWFLDEEGERTVARAFAPL
jgi:hypothetical protein